LGKADSLLVVAKASAGRLAHRPAKLSQRYARDENDESKNQDDENNQGEIKRENQFAEIKEHAQTLRADGVRHGRAHTGWREHHDVIGEFEHNLRKTLHPPDDWLPFFPNRRHRQGQKAH